MHPATIANTEDGWVALVVGNRTYAHSRPPGESGEQRDRHLVGAAPGRLRGDDRAGCRSGGADRGVARVHAPEPGGGRLAVFYAGHGIEMDGCSVLLQQTS